MSDSFFTALFRAISSGKLVLTSLLRSVPLVWLLPHKSDRAVVLHQRAWGQPSPILGCGSTRAESLLALLSCVVTQARHCFQASVCKPHTANICDINSRTH